MGQGTSRKEQCGLGRDLGGWGGGSAVGGGRGSEPVKESVKMRGRSMGVGGGDGRGREGRSCKTYPWTQ